MKTFFFFLTIACNVCNAQIAVRNDSTGSAKLVREPAKKGYTKGDGNVHCSLQDKSGNLWFGTTVDGVYRYDGTSFFNYTTRHGLSSNSVYSILEDRAGNIWFATDEGVCVFDGATITRIPVTNTSSIQISIRGPSGEGVTSNSSGGALLQDRNGKIWLGMPDGVYCFNGRSFSRFLENDSIINRGGVQLRNVQCILEDKHGNIWFGSGMSGREGVSKYDGKTIFNYKPNGYKWITGMSEDKQGNIWFTGRNQGAFMYDGKDFTGFTEDFSLVVSPDAERYCLKGKVGMGAVLTDKKGNVWLPAKTASFGGEGGILRYDGVTCTHFSEVDFLKNASPSSLVEDWSGNIWIGTGHAGLYRFDGKTFTRFSE